MNYQVAIIGGGPAGYSAAEAAGKAGLSTVLFERQNLGGVCLNEGCIPTKTLLYSAKVFDSARQASKYGVGVEKVSFDLPKIIARKQKVVRKLVLGIKAKLSAHGVTLVQGEATILSPTTVQCAGETYHCRHLIICTGSQTVIPSIEGIDSVNYWTHHQALECKEPPASLTVVGGGVIGMEFASFFNSLGTKVTVIEMMDEIVGGMDKELAAMLRADYTKRGIVFLLNTKVVSLSQNKQDVTIYYEHEAGTGSITTEKILMSVGRRPVTRGFGLETLSLVTEHGRITVDKQMRTSQPNVYVCGDLTGFSLLAHTAIREAEVAVNTIAGKEDAMNYRAIPAVVYTNPEIAGVGETEESLRQKGVRYHVSKLPMSFSGRFVAENEGVNGLCKILASEENILLGAHILGNPASEIIALAATAIEQQLTVDQWKRVIFPHPSVCEIFREVI
ncbi:MAG: dihydrolipoyl dehydrogenase [Prevotellaceae bacterium]|jgi:dihydrolipoamide dehydrogenase|nr:dihydrolipoyl dehydrogenase [Prevotellaceae bacterium]